MNSKGFSLMELLAVILIIAILATISIPAVGNILNGSKDKAYNEQVRFIEQAAEKWSISNSSSVNDTGVTYVSLDTLMKSGFIDQDKLIDPRSQQVIKGCVRIAFNSKYDTYDYLFEENIECK